MVHFEQYLYEDVQMRCTHMYDNPERNLQGSPSIDL